MNEQKRSVKWVRERLPDWLDSYPETSYPVKLYIAEQVEATREAEDARDKLVAIVSDLEDERIRERCKLQAVEAERDALAEVRQVKEKPVWILTGGRSARVRWDEESRQVVISNDAADDLFGRAKR